MKYAKPSIISILITAFLANGAIPVSASTVSENQSENIQALSTANWVSYAESSFFENGYIITVRTQNTPVTNDIKTVKLELDKTYTIAFTSTTEAYLNNETLLEAIKLGLPNIKMGNYYLENDIYIIKDVLGQYEASADELAEKFLAEDKLGLFSVVLPKVSNELKLSLINKTYENDKLSFFSVLLGTTVGLPYEELAEKAYNDNRVNFFSLVSSKINEQKKIELLNKSYTNNKIAFFSVLLGKNIAINYDELAEKSYQDNKISFFSIVVSKISEQKKDELTEKSFKDKKISFLSVLMS